MSMTGASFNFGHTAPPPVDAASADRRNAFVFVGVVTAALVALQAPNAQTGLALAAGAAALISTRMAIGALIVVMILRLANPGLVAGSGAFEIFAWGAVMLACGRILLDALMSRGQALSRLPAFFLPYAAVLLTVSVLFSQVRDVSLFKAISFTTVTAAVTLGFAQLRAQGRPASSWIKGLWLAVVVLSVPTFVIPSIGFLRDGQGFQGVLNHPQGFAVFLAPVVAWSAVQAFSAEGRGRAVVIGLFLISFGSLWLTRGRTGLAAIVLAGLALLLLRPGFFKTAAALALRALSKSWVMAGFVLLIPLVVWKAPEMVAAVQEFLLKGSGADAVTGAAAASRGFIADQQILNFQSSPIFGIGFGVSNSATHALNVVIDPVTGLPVGAATEKANLVLAVLEETGIVGALAFLPFFLALILRLARTESLAVAWAALAALGTNVSEMTFFSMGGIGLYTWLIMGWALSEARKAPRRSPTFGRIGGVAARTP
ncbi:MAG TPA: O-antigen ligase family protein [Brevundimonas sp.]|jgi:hypothetical protein|uniref:O-antigen ligase family protein n=1 Tax=Brevundimonas sp. TaxID=1871086 RepID=UPI002DE6E81B|nr:O-antigen ligase family protein [Brevundimonas sp.]